MANTPNDKNRDQNAGMPKVDDLRQTQDRDQKNPNRQQQAEQGKQAQRGAGQTDPNNAKQHGEDNMKKPEQR